MSIIISLTISQIFFIPDNDDSYAATDMPAAMIAGGKICFKTCYTQAHIPARYLIMLRIWIFGEVHMFWCGSAGFHIYTVLYVLIPHTFAPIHSFHGSATNMNFSPRAQWPREFQHISLAKGSYTASTEPHSLRDVIHHWLLAEILTTIRNHSIARDCPQVIIIYSRTWS